MKISEMSTSKYLKATELPAPKLVTIRSLSKTNVAKEGAPREMKWIISFDELDKPMVLNKTNIQRTARALASEETDEWIGKKIVVYNDPDVEMGGELVGGIRVRAPKGATPAPAPTPDPNEEIPF